MMRRGIISLAIVFMASIGITFSAAETAMAAPSSCDQKGMLLTLKPWYYGLTSGSDCSVNVPSGGEGLNKFIMRIALTIVEDLLQIVAFVAVGFIIYGGFVFLTSSGSPDRATAGRKTVTNAAIGMVIAIGAVALVNLVAGGLGI